MLPFTLYEFVSNQFQFLKLFKSRLALLHVSALYIVVQPEEHNRPMVLIRHDSSKLETSKGIMCQNKISALSRWREDGEGESREGERVEDKPWEIGWTATSRSSSFTIALAARVVLRTPRCAAESFHVDGSEILPVRDDPRLPATWPRTKAPGHGRVKLWKSSESAPGCGFPLQ